MLSLRTSKRDSSFYKTSRQNFFGNSTYFLANSKRFFLLHSLMCGLFRAIRLNKFASCNLFLTVFLAKFKFNISFASRVEICECVLTSWTTARSSLSVIARGRPDCGRFFTNPVFFILFIFFLLLLSRYYTHWLVL